MKNCASITLEKNSVFGWLSVGVLLVLLVPLIAMPLTDEVQWTVGDFVVMGCLLFGSGSLFIYLSRKVAKRNRVYVGLCVTVLFLVLWTELAVGIIFDLGS